MATCHFHLKLSFDGNWKLIPCLHKHRLSNVQASYKFVWGCVVRQWNLMGKWWHGDDSQHTSIAATLSAATELKVCVPYSQNILTWPNSRLQKSVKILCWNPVNLLTCMKNSTRLVPVLKNFSLTWIASILSVSFTTVMWHRCQRVFPHAVP